MMIYMLWSESFPGLRNGENVDKNDSPISGSEDGPNDGSSENGSPQNGSSQGTDERPTDPDCQSSKQDGNGAYSDLRYFSFTNSDGTECGRQLWAVFDINYGGNCCEHYLATTPNGWILNLGNIKPFWSPDNGKTWNSFDPTFSVPTTGEGGITAGPDGNIYGIAWSAFEADLLVAYKYDRTSGTWESRVNELHLPLYDRPWITIIPGPFITATGTVQFAVGVQSNVHDDLLMSFNGLDYFPRGHNNVANGFDRFELDYNPPDNFEYIMPIALMTATPIPSGGMILPKDSGDLSSYFDTDYMWEWYEHPSGTPIPGKHLFIDSSGNLHSISTPDPTTISHSISKDGGTTWSSWDHEWPESQGIETWEFRANADVGLAAIFVRLQLSGRDQDLLLKVFDYEEDLRADEVHFIGDGDIDTSSGITGTGERFDFASMALMPDGRVVVAFADSTSNDPLFALELDS